MGSSFSNSKSINMPINKALFGDWDMCGADSANFDAYMKECGVGLVLRTGAKVMKQTIKIVDDVPEGKLHLVTESTLKNSDQVFELGGVEQDEKTLDGRNCKTTFEVTAEGNIHEVQKFNGKEATLDWNSTGADTFELVLKCGGVTCVRKHARK